MRNRLAILIVATPFILGLGLHVPVAIADEPEVPLTEDDFKKLDTFEGHSLAKADRVYGQKDYRAAAAEYDAFLLEFPKSLATAYAILRKARCLQLDNKRNDAIKVYREVLDYFPNATEYAAAALYYIGQSNWQNGDVKEALKAWMDMADDVDYRKHRLAAGAINQLADNLVQQGKPDQAAEYYKQVAMDFRRSNRDAARYAIDKALNVHIRLSPNEPKLAEFYEKAGGFDWDPRKPDPTDYWNWIRGRIRQFATFTPEEKDKRDAYYRYWAGIMEGKRPTDDEFQIDLADFKRAYEGDVSTWTSRLDQQFAKNQKEGDYGRVVRWISVFHEQKNKVQEYYGKLDFAKMNNQQIDRLLRSLIDEAKDREMSRNVFAKLQFDKMSDDEKYRLERYLWERDEDLVVETCNRMTDKEYGSMELLRYYHWRRNADKGLTVADGSTSVPQYAKEAYYMKGEMLQWKAKYPEAIQSFQAADNPPHNIFRIAECFMAQGKREQAIGQLRELENFFVDWAPEAAMRIAWIYRDTNDKQQYVSNLRNIMKKYPKSGQSGQAHQELERMGVKIGGGVDAE